MIIKFFFIYNINVRNAIKLLFISYLNFANRDKLLFYYSFTLQNMIKETQGDFPGFENACFRLKSDILRFIKSTPSLQDTSKNFENTALSTFYGFEKIAKTSRKAFGGIPNTVKPGLKVFRVFIENTLKPP